MVLGTLSSVPQGGLVGRVAGRTIGARVGAHFHIWRWKTDKAGRADEGSGMCVISFQPAVSEVLNRRPLVLTSPSEVEFLIFSWAHGCLAKKDYFPTSFTNGHQEGLAGFCLGAGV